MKSIIEFLGKQIEIELPEAPAQYSTWLSNRERSNTVPINKEIDPAEFMKELMSTEIDEVFTLVYSTLAEYYQYVAIEKFRNDNLVFDGFCLLTDDMNNNSIADYCKFIDETGPLPNISLN